MLRSIGECLMPTDRQTAIAHLQMLQAIIARMAESSRHVKTWTITLFAAVAFVSLEFQNAAYTVGAGIVVIGFIIDAYYVAMEKAYRAKFNCHAKRIRKDIPLGEDLFDLSPGNASPFFAGALVSPGTWPVYALLAVAALALALQPFYP